MAPTMPSRRPNINLNNPTLREGATFSTQYPPICRVNPSHVNCRFEPDRPNARKAIKCERKAGQRNAMQMRCKCDVKSYQKCNAMRCKCDANAMQCVCEYECKRERKCNANAMQCECKCRCNAMQHNTRDVYSDYKSSSRIGLRVCSAFRKNAIDAMQCNDPSLLCVIQH